MVWYRVEDYSRILEIMSDADKLPPTFEQWLVRAERGERDMKSQGVFIVRAMLDPDEFVARCAKKGTLLDAKARMEFGNEIAYRHFGKTH